MSKKITPRTGQRLVIEEAKKIAEEGHQRLPLLVRMITGGGKSVVPGIIHSFCAPSVIDKVLTVVPNNALSNQAAEAGPVVFEGFEQKPFQLRQATNEIDPCRGAEGYVSTYAALGCDASGINAFELERHRYALILDEAHHLAEGSDWHRAVVPLWDRATIRVVMTGSLCRSDDKAIAFMPYELEEAF